MKRLLTKLLLGVMVLSVSSCFTYLGPYVPESWRHFGQKSHVQTICDQYTVGLIR